MFEVILEVHFFLLIKWMFCHLWSLNAI